LEFDLFVILYIIAYHFFQLKLEEEPKRFNEGRWRFCPQRLFQTRVGPMVIPKGLSPLNRLGGPESPNRLYFLPGFKLSHSVERKFGWDLPTDSNGITLPIIGY